MNDSYLVRLLDQCLETPSDANLALTEAVLTIELEHLRRVLLCIRRFRAIASTKISQA
jgi:hypothetical protein